MIQTIERSYGLRTVPFPHNCPVMVSGMNGAVGRVTMRITGCWVGMTADSDRKFEKWGTRVRDQLGFYMVAFGHEAPDELQNLVVHVHESRLMVAGGAR